MFFWQPNSAAKATPRSLREHEHLRKGVGLAFPAYEGYAYSGKRTSKGHTGTSTNALLGNEKNNNKSIAK